MKSQDGENTKNNKQRADPLFDALIPTDVNMGMIFSSLSGSSIHDDILQEHPVFHLTHRQRIANADLDKLFASHAFRDLIAERLSGAVKVPTVTYDGMKKVGEDPRWDVFYQFATYLEKKFPKV
jgi:Gly-Xaa carboxypeptidase